MGMTGSETLPAGMGQDVAHCVCWHEISLVFAYNGKTVPTRPRAGSTYPDRGGH